MALKLYTLDSIALASGTATPLASEKRFVSSVTVQADISNTGAVFIGGLGTTNLNGFQLSAGDSTTIEPPPVIKQTSEFDLSTVIAYATTTGQVIRLTFMSNT